MNLIEQLSGYEKAKETLIAEQRSKNIDPVIYINGDEVLIDALDDALLDYRRQHKIYEAGDLVVMVGNGTKDLLLEVIEYKYTNNLYRVNVLSTGSCGPIHKDQIRHATDAEIEAGKRLEVG